MTLANAEVPSDPAGLREFALACQAELTSVTAELNAAKLALQCTTLEIEKLKFQLAKLRRMQFGRSSERLNRQIEQLELQIEELKSDQAQQDAEPDEAQRDEAESQPKRRRRKRKPLPDHLPRQEIVHQPENDGDCTCPCCGAGMAKLGEDVTEVLDYIPGHFRVIRHLRPKYACDTITQEGSRFADAARPSHAGDALTSAGVEIL
jgi:septal ring factor EnvC (AmiA/AmiB activator)